MNIYLVFNLRNYKSIWWKEEMALQRIMTDKRFSNGYFDLKGYLKGIDVNKLYKYQISLATKW